MQALWGLLTKGTVTQTALFPELPPVARGLPRLTQSPCDGCQACEAICPSRAIAVNETSVQLDLGACLACGLCTDVCPSGTIVATRGTRTAVRTRAELVLRNAPAEAREIPPPPRRFRRSLHVRVVSCGDSATDLEVAASNNAIFDASRFGIHVVASPRFADALLVTGPVGLAMQEPLRRCYEAMAEPRLVIAAGAAAISGGLHAGGYARANGVGEVLPVDAFVPGNPPHPWSVLHGLMTAMGHPGA